MCLICVDVKFEISSHVRHIWHLPVHTERPMLHVHMHVRYTDM